MKYIRRAGIVLLVCLMAMVSVGADQRVINVLNTPQNARYYYTIILRMISRIIIPR